VAQALAFVVCSQGRAEAEDIFEKEVNGERSPDDPTEVDPRAELLS
jgi:Flp pilus assembly protein TadD